MTRKLQVSLFHHYKISNFAVAHYEQGSFECD